MGNTFTSSHRNHNLFMNIYPETQNPLYTKRSMNRPSRKYERLDNPKTQGCPPYANAAHHLASYTNRGAHHPARLIRRISSIDITTKRPFNQMLPYHLKQWTGWEQYMLDDSSLLDRLYLNSQFKLDSFWRVGCHRMPDVFIEVEHPPYAQNHQWP